MKSLRFSLEKHIFFVFLPKPAQILDLSLKMCPDPGPGPEVRRPAPRHPGRGPSKRPGPGARTSGPHGPGPGRGGPARPGPGPGGRARARTSGLRGHGPGPARARGPGFWSPDLRGPCPQRISFGISLSIFWHLPWTSGARPGPGVPGAAPVAVARQGRIATGATPGPQGPPAPESQGRYQNETSKSLTGAWSTATYVGIAA